MSEIENLNEKIAVPELRTSLLRRLAGPLVVIAVGAVLYLSVDRKSTVTGVVTLDDKPLSSGLVRFHPVTQGPIASGRIDSQGRYELETGGQVGLASGEYIVTVGADGDGKPAPFVAPAKYAEKETSGRRANVRRGANQIDFDLWSRN